MDIADAAEELIEMQTALGVASVLAKRPEGNGAVWCDECGEVIPHQRRKVLPGVRLCVECADGG